MPASKIAEAYVQIIPRIEGMTAGIKSQLDDKIGPVIDKAGKDGGKKFGLAFEDGAKDLNKRIDKLFKGIGVAALAAGAGITAFAKSSIGQASKLEESINAVNVSYGDAAQAVLAIGENSAKSFGVAQSEFNAAAVRFSAFAERVVGSGGDVAGFIGDITGRAADFASVFNIDVAEALRVFQSGLSGEAEPLKRFGINLLETEVNAYAVRTGMIELGGTLTETQKVQARYGLLMESTNKTQGDFANTSDSLANKQRILQATFTDLQARIGTALLPVMGELVTLVADFLLPKMEEFSTFLQSAEGKKAIEDFGQALKDVLTATFNFIEFIIKNRDAIAQISIALLGGVAAFRAYTGAMLIADAVTVAFTGKTLAGVAATNTLATALKAIPWVALAAGATWFVTSITEYATEVNKSRVNTEGLTEAQAKQAQRVEGLQRLLGQYQYALENGNEASKQLAREGITNVTNQLNAMGIQAGIAGGEIGRFNNIKLNGLRKEIGDTAGEMNRFANIVKGLAKVEEDNPTILSTGPSAAEKKQQAFEKVQKFIKDAQKAVREAQKTYTETITKAQRDYSEAVLRTEKDFADRLAGIVQQSQNRLRDAYANVVRTPLSELFKVEEQTSVQNLITGLSTRLAKSRELLANAGKLNAAGFTQTFIEQVVSAGIETGNELANAILTATPETQAELQKLFLETEKTAETGMDALAQRIYEKAGLATNELKALYSQTQNELTSALLQLKQDYDDQIVEANDTLNKALIAVKENFAENIASMKGELGGLQSTVKQFMGTLDSLIAKSNEAWTAARRAANAGSSWAGVVPAPSTTGVVVPRQPVYLASGGYVSQPTSAIIGEAGPEVVMPLDRFESIMGLSESAGKTVNYYAAPNQSLDSEQALFQAMRRAKVVANW